MLDFLYAIYDFMLGLYTMIEDAATYVIDAVKLVWFDFTILIFDFNLGVLLIVLQTTGFIDEAQAVFSSFPPWVSAGVVALRIPEALNIIISAYGWKKAMKVVRFAIPGL